jgi:hypothetical protein
VDEHLQRVYVVTQDAGKAHQEQLVVLDAATGDTVSGQGAGPAGPALAVDQQTGVVFYLDQASGTIIVLAGRGA